MEFARFTATLLRNSASGFAGMAVSRAFEASGDEGGASGGFDAWRAHFSTLVLELAAAVDVGRRDQFAAKVGWERDAFAARGVGTELLGCGLQELRAVLEESLPAEAWAVLPEYFEAAVGELNRPAETDEAAAEMADPLGKMALAYLTSVREGDGRQAIEEVLAAVRERRISTSDALDGVLTRALREIGRLWHTGAVNVAEEHVVTQATGRLLEQVVLAAPNPVPYPRTVVLTMAEGDAHEIGLRIVAAFFELDGWRTICLGANTPASDLALAAHQFDADLVVIGATLNTHREAAVRAIKAVKEMRPDQKILIGGPGFDGLGGKAHEIGAHGSVSLGRNAPLVGRELFTE